VLEENVHIIHSLKNREICHKNSKINEVFQNKLHEINFRGYTVIESRLTIEIMCYKNKLIINHYEKKYTHVPIEFM